MRAILRTTAKPMPLFAPVTIAVRDVGAAMIENWVLKENGVRAVVREEVACQRHGDVEILRSLF